jgi:ribA/ribD-fused uncharacterized protein
MKRYTLLKIIFCFLILCSNCLAIDNNNDNDEEIPHYKVYPKTPIVDYKNEILDFYSVKDPYGEFSNFGLFPILMDEKIWPSSEHYYQAQKFFDENLKEIIRNAPTPYEAAKLARDPKMPLREDWDEVKDSVMEKVVREKFKQYRVLRDLLKSTNDSHIFEHTKNDCYWADCLDRTGLNKLGHIIEKIRTEALWSEKE